MYPLVVFDLDGTLIDSLGDLSVAVNRLVAELGGRPLGRDAVAGMVGEGAALLVGRAFAASGISADVAATLPRFLEVYDSLLPGETRPYPGVHEMLAALRGTHRLAVLTNKPTAPTLKLLSQLGLAPFLADVVGGDGPVRRKPDPEGLRHLMTRSGADASGTVLVGDSTVDVRTARAAGTRMCVARYGFGQANFDTSALTGDEWTIDRPGDLVSLLSDRGTGG